MLFIDLRGIHCSNMYHREKKRRKEAATVGGQVVKEGAEGHDKVYITTVFMPSSMLAAFPYDMPHFAASLLVSVLRHNSVPFFQDTVTKTIQDFKRTHQDRWDDCFKYLFTKEQLDDLQGAGAQTYFT